MQVNDITLTGNLGKDAELKKSTNGTEYGLLSMCYSDKGKDGKDYSFWTRVKFFGGWTKMVPALKKGTPVIVKGKLSVFDYKNDKGEEKTLHEILAYNIGIFHKEPRLGHPEGPIPNTNVSSFNIDEVPF